MKKIHHQLIFNKTLHGTGALLVLLGPLFGFLLLSSPTPDSRLSLDVFWLHSALELFSVVVCACIFIVGWHVLDESRPKMSVLLACSFLAIGLLDSAHLLSYQGMPDFVSPNSDAKTLAFRLAARLIAALALLVYVLPGSRALEKTDFLFKFKYLLVSLLSVLVIGSVVVFTPDLLLPLLISEERLGPLAYVLELVVISLHLLTLFHLFGKKSVIDAHNRSGLALAMSLMVISESFFLLVSYTADASSYLGHIYKAAAYVFLYRTIFMNNITLPVIRLQDAHKKLQHYANQTDELLSNAPDGIVGADSNGRISFINSRMEEMFGYRRDELIGKQVEILLPISLRERHGHLRSDYVRAPAGRPMTTTRGLVGRCKDGRELPLDIALGFHQGESGMQITAFIRDISERQKLEAEMVHRASHDQLTGLPNRALLQDRLQRALVQSRRNQTGFALIMIDLDNFKDVNDGWGHSVGDQLLVIVARRLSRVLREGDTVARFGGDEFVIVAENMADSGASLPIVEKILASLAHVIVIGDMEFVVSASVGVANYPQHAGDAETLLSHADIAMYHAKNSGRRTACFFDDKMGLHKQQQMQIKSWLISALEKNELLVYYQPQYRISDRSIIGFEALLRWHHPEGGWIPPDQFIPVAEASGLIIPVTEWILNQVCTQISMWEKMGFQQRVSVNISALHFRREGELSRLVEFLLAKSGISPRLLGLELTETALMDNPDVAVDTLRRMVGHGVHIAIDDFGTGYSSLASLQLYPLHTLKVDRSFMVGLTLGNKSAAIVCGLVNLASSLGLEVLAEGVETEDQFEILKACGCNSIQGWLMNPAMSSLDCTQLLSGMPALDQDPHH